MDNSVGTAIEKIKLLEQDKEAKLKEKRELEAAFASLNRAIREKTSQAEKLDQDQKTISNNINILTTQLTIEKVRSDALNKQLYSFNKELEDVRAKSNNGISNVWQQRSNLSNAIHTACDKYDIWALFMKPRTLLITESIIKQDESNPIIENEHRLQEAIKRRENILKQRDLLKSEPDNGEEFIRIKNALRYSLEKVEELRKK